MRLAGLGHHVAPFSFVEVYLLPFHTSEFSGAHRQYHQQPQRRYHWIVVRHEVVQPAQEFGQVVRGFQGSMVFRLVLLQ
ncbi:hypothetical protein D3C80_1494760 [compost metagenome]